MDQPTPIDFAIVVLSGTADRAATLATLQKTYPGCAPKRWQTIAAETRCTTDDYDVDEDAYSRILTAWESERLRNRVASHVLVFVDNALQGVSALCQSKKLVHIKFNPQRELPRAETFYPDKLDAC
jgi:hypothetical protein